MTYITILIFSILPMISIPLILIGICIYKKNRLLLFFLLAIILAIISYYLETPQDYDLYKYFRVMEKYTSINNFIDIFKVDYEMLFCIILYIISKIGNYRLLSCVFTLFSYFSIFYIIDDYSKKIKLSNIKTFILILFFILTFNYINFASGLRNTTGMIIGLLAIYLEYVKNKKGVFYKFIYIIPCFLHKSLFIFIIFRLMMLLDYKKIKKIYIPFMIAMFFSGNLIIYIARLLSNIYILESLEERAISYISKEGNIFTSPMVLYCMAIGAFLMILYLYNKKNNRQYINEKLYEWISIFLVLCLAVMPYKVLFARFIVLFNLMSIFILADFLNNEKKKINYIFIIVCILIIFIVSIVVQLTMLQNVSFGNLFSDGLTKNIYSIFKLE